MGEAAIHSSDRSASEQEQNGVQTGFNDGQLFEFMDELVSGWRECNRLDALLLKALFRLSVDDPLQAQEGFTPIEVAEAIGRLRGRAWSDGSDKERMSDDVRRQWNKLLGLWATKEEGIQQALCDAGHAVTPVLNKTEGGGAGRLTRYRIDWVTTALAVSTSSTTGSERFGEPSDIRYRSEDLQEAGRLVRFLGQGYRLEGWRRGVLAALLITSILVAALLVILVLLQTMYYKALDGRQLVSSLLSLAVFGVVFWSTTGRILRLADRKIVVAPWWMQSVDDDRLLERREPPRFTGKAIKAVRYTSICPICQAKITVKSGGLEFWGRLVGRCENAPVEHVFSFDHVTRNGSPLRTR